MAAWRREAQGRLEDVLEAGLKEDAAVSGPVKIPPEWTSFARC